MSTFAFLLVLVGATQTQARRLAGSHSHTPAASHPHSPHSHTPHSHSPAAAHTHSPDPPSPPPPSPSPPPAAEGISERFLFVDEAAAVSNPTGRWSHTGIAYQQPLRCAIGGTVAFRWTQPHHDVTLMASKSAFDACDFTNSTTLAAAGGTGESQYYLPCSTAGSTMYVSCSIGGHCAAGQKVVVNVSASVRAVDAVTGEALIHVTSLARVLTLMGAYEPANAPGTALLPHGYDTELAANTTLDFVWCLTSHCPASAQTHNPAATLESCKADVYNLGGFLSRKRPSPQLAHAAEYYRQALAYDPNHCATLQYSTELFLTLGDLPAASSRVTALCQRCGRASGFATLARDAFDQSGLAGSVGAFDLACPLSPPPSTPPMPPAAPTEATATAAEEQQDSASSSRHRGGSWLALGCVLYASLAMLPIAAM